MTPSPPVWRPTEVFSSSLALFLGSFIGMATTILILQALGFWTPLQRLFHPEAPTTHQDAPVAPVVAHRSTHTHPGP